MVGPERRTSLAIGDHLFPNHVSVSVYDGVRSTELVCFLGEQAGVNTSEDNVSPPFPRQVADRVSSQCVGSVNTDPNNIAGLNGRRVERGERLIHENGVAILPRSSGGENKQPPWSDYSGTESGFARVYEMNAQY